MAQTKHPFQEDSMSENTTSLGFFLKVFTEYRRQSELFPFSPTLAERKKLKDEDLWWENLKINTLASTSSCVMVCV